MLIALRSLAGQCGVFDAPNEKIPPDISVRGIHRGGSLGSVTDWPASRSSSLSSSDSDISTPSSSPAFTSSKGGKDFIYSHTPPHSDSSLDNENFNGGVSAPALGEALKTQSITSVSQSAPRDIPISNQVPTGISKEALIAFHNQNTPPLSPDSSGSESAPFAFHGPTHDAAAHEFLTRLFPGAVRVALPHAKSVRISSSELAVEPSILGSGIAFEGVVLEAPGHPRTLYIDGKGVENFKLRERYVFALL